MEEAAQRHPERKEEGIWQRNMRNAVLEQLKKDEGLVNVVWKYLTGQGRLEDYAWAIEQKGKRNRTRNRGKKLEVEAQIEGEVETETESDAGASTTVLDGCALPGLERPKGKRAVFGVKEDEDEDEDVLWAATVLCGIQGKEKAIAEAAKSKSLMMKPHVRSQEKPKTETSPEEKVDEICPPLDQRKGKDEMVKKPDQSAKKKGKREPVIKIFASTNPKKQQRPFPLGETKETAPPVPSLPPILKTQSSKTQSSKTEYVPMGLDTLTADDTVGGTHVTYAKGVQVLCSTPADEAKQTAGFTPAQYERINASGATVTEGGRTDPYNHWTLTNGETWKEPKPLDLTDAFTNESNLAFPTEDDLKQQQRKTELLLKKKRENKEEADHKELRRASMKEQKEDAKVGVAARSDLPKALKRRRTGGEEAEAPALLKKEGLMGVKSHHLRSG
jgi:hypothetical protein